MNWNKQKIKSFQNSLLSWYEAHKKPLPWRETNEPYAIWISEIMSQQTQVETVIPYYERFIHTYPNVASLATANDEELLKLWEGLGYYSRARNLKFAAQQIVKDYDGKFPSNLSDIKSLKGIGPYTAAAISSISFGMPEPAIDGNLLRVTSRLFELENDISKISSRKIFDAILRELISENEPGNFNQALMDVGSLVCSPKLPKCEECPIQSYCVAYVHGIQENFPIKTKKLKQKPMYYQAFAIQNTSGEYLLEQRPLSGLLAGMWTFPMIEVEKNAEIRLPSSLHDVVVKTENVGEVTHIFSHLKWFVTVVKCELATDIIRETASYNQKWTTVDDEYTVFPKPQLKMFELLKN